MTNTNGTEKNQEVFANYTITVSTSDFTPEQLATFDDGSKITLTSASGETIELAIENLSINGIEWADEEKNADGFHIPIKE